MACGPPSRPCVLNKAPASPIRTEMTQLSPADAAPRRSCELSIVVPVFCAGDSVAGLVARLRGALGETAWEVVFVDDNSPDDTVAAIAVMAQTDPRVRVIRRVGRSGLTQT